VRVVDASVIPLTTGVAIQSTVYAIAEKVGLRLNRSTRSDQAASQAADVLRKELGLE
jgi:choline dehydrogenase-like flavoprotein